MAYLLSPDNAIGFAQVRLRGGWKNLGWTALAYALAVGGAMVATSQMMSDNPARAYGNWVPGLLGLQGAILLFFGVSRVTSAIRSDLTTGIIESHRLMPTEAGPAVLGYVFGSTSQAILLAAANVLIGAYASAKASLPLDRWVAANAVFFWFVGCVWLVSAMLAFGPKGAPALLFVPLASVWFTQAASLKFLPGMAVLLSPLAGKSIFSWSNSLTAPAYAFTVGALAQAFFAAVCFVAACRKYKRSDWQGLTAPLGLLMLAGWVVVSVVGTWQWEEFRPVFVRSYDTDPGGQLITTVIVTMLLALLPVAAAMAADVEWNRRRARIDPALRRRPLSPVAIVAAATALIVGLAAAVLWWDPSPEWPRRLPRLGAIVFLALLCPGYLFRIYYRGGGRGPFVAVGWLVVVWVGPLLAEAAVRVAVEPNPVGEFPGPLACCSPPAAAYRVLNMDPDGAGATNPGLLAHAWVAALVALWFHRGAAGRRGRAVAVEN